jgi:hypothetical protein
MIRDRNVRACDVDPEEDLEVELDDDDEEELDEQLLDDDDDAGDDDGV